jgi:hypothetical protein
MIKIGTEILCAKCGVKVIKGFSRQIYCDECIWVRPKNGNGPGAKAKCLICEKEFIKKGGYHIYCEVCGAERKKELQKINVKNNYTRVKKYRREWAREKHAETKKIILTHYGKNGRLRCCWHGCKIIDVDMLSLDHIDDNGKEDRANGQKPGAQLYIKLVKQNFPAGFQTLCFNHQFKKEILRRREAYL